MPKQEFVCAVCGTTFEKYLCQLKSEAPYCSKECVGRAKRTGVVLQCTMCDSSFYQGGGERKRKERNGHDSGNDFCSRACYMDWRALNRKASVYARVGARHVHRLVAEAVLGRALISGEVVHHIDEDKHNNHPSNLAVFPDQSTHMRCHAGKMTAQELDSFRLEQFAAA